MRNLWCVTRLHLMSAALAALLVSLTGCATLPDAQPFTDATVGLRSAVASSGAAVVGELERSPIRGMDVQAKNLATAWDERNKLLSALVEYANSLQSIVDSGKQGAAAVNALAASVSQLAAAANIVEPGAGEAGRLITETAAYVYSHIAKARAASSLEKALAAVQPSVERIAQTMASQMQALDDLIRVACKAQRDELRISNQSRISYRESLVTSREKLMNQLRTDLEAGKKPSELPQFDELKRLEELLATSENWNKPLQQDLQTIAERERLSRQLITETKSGFSDWASAHARMLTAVRTKRLPSAVELIEATQRIRELVAKFQKL